MAVRLERFKISPEGFVVSHVSNEQSDSVRIQLGLGLDASDADTSSSLDQLLALAIASNASDIILVNRYPVTFR